MEDRQREEPPSPNLLMPHYRFLLESDERLQQVNVDCTRSVETAIGRLRQHFDFEQWRIVNIAEKAQEG